MLKAHGERATAARRGVIGVLAEHQEHLSADEVATRLAGEGVHRTTVYRTLERFAELGVVALRQLPGEAAAYHLATSTHLHGHCRRCGEVIALPPEAFDGAAEALRFGARFHLDLDKSTLVGLCMACSAAGPSRSVM